MGRRDTTATGHRALVPPEARLGSAIFLPVLLTFFFPWVRFDDLDCSASRLPQAGARLLVGTDASHRFQCGQPLGTERGTVHVPPQPSAWLVVAVSLVGGALCFVRGGLGWFARAAAALLGLVTVGLTCFVLEAKDFRQELPGGYLRVGRADLGGGALWAAYFYCLAFVMNTTLPWAFFRPGVGIGGRLLYVLLAPVVSLVVWFASVLLYVSLFWF